MKPEGVMTLEGKKERFVKGTFHRKSKGNPPKKPFFWRDNSDFPESKVDDIDGATCVMPPLINLNQEMVAEHEKEQLDEHETEQFHEHGMEQIPVQRTKQFHGHKMEQFPVQRAEQLPETKMEPYGKLGVWILVVYDRIFGFGLQMASYDLGGQIQ